ncbi:MAG: hypothetical protein M3Y44_03860 [Actinomycetota bacterium]|nr:hypothetical protein [Actinomycetota bacterium]
MGTQSNIHGAANDVRQALAGPQVLVHSDLHDGNIVRTPAWGRFPRLRVRI